jgi:hypothetical protein
MKNGNEAVEEDEVDVPLLDEEAGGAAGYMNVRILTRPC